MSQRLRKSRGSVEQRGRHWYLRIVRSAPARHRARIELGDVNTIRSSVAARRAADAWLSRNHPEQLTEGKSIAFADYADLFLKTHAALFRGSSQKVYRSRVHTHLVPELGSLPLWHIGPSQIRAMLARRRATGLRRSTLMAVRAVLLHVLRQAKVDGYDVQAIDAKLVRLPREDIAEVEQRHISPDELEQILAAAAFPWRALYAVQGLAGLRISEALGLAWSHLDLQGPAPLMRVRQGAAGGVLLPLKTRTSRADLPLLPDLVQILTEYLAVWRPNDAGLLFASRNGKPLLADSIRTRQWQPLLKRLGLAPAGFHALRHGLPRQLFAAGCSAPVVQALLRHGSLQMTQRYTHSSAEDLRAALHASQKFRTRTRTRPSQPQTLTRTQEKRP